MAFVRVTLAGYVGDVRVVYIVLATLENAYLAQRCIDELEMSPPPAITALKLAIDKALGFSFVNYFFLREQA